MMAVTARTGLPPGISPPSRTRKSPAPTQHRSGLLSGPPRQPMDHRHASAPQAHHIPSSDANRHQRREQAHRARRSPHRRRSRLRDLCRHVDAGHAGALTPRLGPESRSRRFTRHSDPGVGQPSGDARAAYRSPGKARPRVAAISTRSPIISAGACAFLLPRQLLSVMPIRAAFGLSSVRVTS